MPFIVAVQCETPPHYYEQDALVNAWRPQWQKHFFNPERLEQFHRSVLVGGRHLALPLERYAQLNGLKERNEAFLQVAGELAVAAVSRLLARCDLPAEAISCLLSSTVTGLAVPSLEARLMNRLPFAATAKRLPLFGLGCLAGVAGLARMADYLVGYPREAGVVFTVELCSLTVQKDDLSIANIISSGLFGDGCGAVLMVGDDHPLAARSALHLQAWQSAFFPDTERVMGFDIVDDGFKVVLSSEVPQMVTMHMPRLVAAVLAAQGLRREDLEFFICHPGGPKVLEAMAAALGVGNDALRHSYESLSEYGNMSSASVLFVLDKTLKDSPPRSNARGLMTAMGPAFCAETILVTAC